MANIDWQLAGSIIFTGLSVVFAVLVILWLMIALMGSIMKNFEKKAPVEASQTIAPVATTQNHKLSDVEVAVITAAASEVVKGNFTIKEISLHNTNTLVFKAE